MLKTGGEGDGGVQELSGLIGETCAARTRERLYVHALRFLFPSLSLSVREYPVVSVHIRLLRTHDELYEGA